MSPGGETRPATRASGARAAWPLAVDAGQHPAIAAWARPLGRWTERRALEAAAALCASLGHRIGPVPPPDLDGPALGDAFFLVAGAAVAGVVAMVDRLRGVPVQADRAPVPGAPARGAPAAYGAGLGLHADPQHRRVPGDVGPAPLDGRGVPVGVHFAAAPGDDALLLGLADQLEAARPWKDRWARGARE